MKLEDKKVLVTGGAGFIGSNLVDALVKKSCQVTVLDDFSKGREENLEKSREKIKLVRGSVEDSKLVDRLVTEVDVIFHEAALNLVLSTRDPRKDLLVNTLGTLNILEAMRKRNGAEWLVYASSGSIYGEPEYNPQDESHPLNPTSQYGVSKLAADKYATLYHQLYGLKTICLRYYNVYGPRQSHDETGGVIPIFVKRSLQNKPPVVEGDGSQQRCFTNVNDVIRATMLAAESSISGDAFNIGTDESTTILQLAEMIIRLSGRKLKPEFKKEREGDVKVFSPDITRAQKELEYEPQVKLKDGLPLVVEWMKNELKI